MEQLLAGILFVLNHLRFSHSYLKGDLQADGRSKLVLVGLEQGSGQDERVEDLLSSEQSLMVELELFSVLNKEEEYLELPREEGAVVSRQHPSGKYLSGEILGGSLTKYASYDILMEKLRQYGHRSTERVHRLNGL